MKQEVLKTLLKGIGMTQTELAEALRMSQSSIACWKRYGGIPPNRIDEICALFPRVSRKFLETGNGKLFIDERDKKDIQVYCARNGFVVSTPSSNYEVRDEEDLKRIVGGIVLDELQDALTSDNLLFGAYIGFDIELIHEHIIAN